MTHILTLKHGNASRGVDEVREGDALRLAGERLDVLSVPGATRTRHDRHC